MRRDVKKDTSGEPQYRSTCARLHIQVCWKGFARKAFCSLCYHPSARRVRPGVRPRGSTGYAERNMGLSEAVYPRCCDLWLFAGLFLVPVDFGLRH